MRLRKLVLNKVKKYTDITEFDFNICGSLNTVSGKNGAGKTTVFESLLKVQKAYFVQKILSENARNNPTKLFEEMSRELFEFLSEESSFIEVAFLFDSRDTRLISPPPQEVGNEVAVTVEEGNEQSEEQEVKLKLLVDKIENEQVYWRIEISEHENALLEAYWNLKEPKNIIAYISSNKSVVERDITFNNIRLKQDSEISPIVRFILAPDSLFENLYESLINDYLYEKIIPVNRGGRSPRKDIYFHVTKVLFSNIIPNLTLVNLSGTKRESQFIFCVKNSIMETRPRARTRQYDLRNFSSGEKLIWYTLLFINYIKNMGILIIDEPENHLHEELLCKLSTVLHDIAESTDYRSLVLSLNTGRSISTLDSELDKAYSTFRLNQVFLLTHSKSLIYHNFSRGQNLVLSDTLIPMDYENCEKSLRRFGLSYINDKVLFVEGRTEIEIFEQKLDRYNIKVRELENCGDIIKTFQVISRINEHLKDPMFVFLIDKDTRSNQEIESLRERYGTYFDEHFIVMDKHEIENYYLEPRIILSVLEEFQDEDYTPPSLEEIKELIYNKATEQLIYTKKKFLNNFLNNKIEKLNSLVHQRELNVETKDGHSRYVDQLFNSERFTNIKYELINSFDDMEQVYSQENWGANWQLLMDGKSVFSIVTSNLATSLEIRPSKLQRKIKRKALETSDSELNQMICSILDLFGITFEIRQLEDDDEQEEL